MMEPLASVLLWFCNSGSQEWGWCNIAGDVSLYTVSGQSKAYFGQRCRYYFRNFSKGLIIVFTPYWIIIITGCTRHGAQFWGLESGESRNRHLFCRFRVGCLLPFCSFSHNRLRHHGTRKVLGTSPIIYLWLCLRRRAVYRLRQCRTNRFASVGVWPETKQIAIRTVTSQVTIMPDLFGCAKV